MSAVDGVGALGVELELVSPALLAAGPPASNLVESLLFVPGSTVRGLLAWRSIEEGADPASKEFRDLFLAGQVRFGAATPGGASPATRRRGAPGGRP